MNGDDSVLNLNVSQKTNWTKNDQFNMLYLNINSIRNKLYDLEDIVSKNKSKITHLIAFTETRISDNETEFFNIPNYNSYYSNRSDGHGGAALFVHNSLDSNLIASGVKFKVNFVIVNIPILKTSIAIVYKKPTVSISEFLTVLIKILERANRIIVIGKATNFLMRDSRTLRSKIKDNLVLFCIE